MTAFIWLVFSTLTTLGFGAAYVVGRIRGDGSHRMGLAVSLINAGWTLELATANGYLRETVLLIAVKAACLLVAVGVSTVEVLRQRTTDSPNDVVG